MDFCQSDDEGNKNFKYSEQLTRVAHREQVILNFFLNTSKNLFFVSASLLSTIVSL